MHSTPVTLAPLAEQLTLNPFWRRRSKTHEAAAKRNLQCLQRCPAIHVLHVDAPKCTEVPAELTPELTPKGGSNLLLFLLVVQPYVAGGFDHPFTWGLRC
jgi:hypothetical protein